MSKNLWLAAYESLLEELGREPTEAEVREEISTWVDVLEELSQRISEQEIAKQEGALWMN